MRIKILLMVFMPLTLTATTVLAVMVVDGRERSALESLNIESLTANAERGEYVASMGGCIACHTHTEKGGELLAGGVPIKTPFGTFYTPNITSDRFAGIGGWSLESFVSAMTLGVSPKQEHYFPAFPYTSYSAMTAQDLVDLKAWLDTVTPVGTEAPTHDITWPFSIRSSLIGWKMLFFDPTTDLASADRGDYIVNGPGHCAECHASRNLLGGLAGRTLRGNSRGPDGEAVPGITSSHLKEWTQSDLELFLEVGITPSGDFTGGHMADVIEYSTGMLTTADRESVAQYLLSESNSL